jgi:hypothetical protein
LPRLQFVVLLFSSQPGTAALRPSVPCQGKDWTSIIIEPTHIPRVQWSTAGAATSSGLSQVNISQDQGSTADATESSGFSQGHISQVQESTAGAATSSGLSQGHISQDQGSTAGAATNSGLSQGRASRMCWQSRDDQRAELRDAIDVETAEVKPESNEKTERNLTLLRSNTFPAVSQTSRRLPAC